MEWYVAGIAILGLLVVLIGLGLPIPFALCVASLPFLWDMQSFSTSIMTAEMMLWKLWGNYILLAVPLFIFLGDLVGHSQIGSRLYDAMHRGIPIRGSAALGSVGACAGFGAICGSSMIGAMTIGRVALPEMLRLGYGSRLSSGVIAAGGTLSVLIPPSLILLFYGIVTDVSIGKLFIAGVIPGIALASLFAVVIWIWAIVRSHEVPPREQSGNWSLTMLVTGLTPPVIIGAIIVAAIYFGIATPTEAAAVAVLATLAAAIFVGGLTLRGIVEAMKSTIKTMGFLGILFGAALLFGFVLNYHRIPQELTTLVSQSSVSPSVVLALVILFFLFIGMFLEPASIVFIALPTIFPLVEAAGFNMIWFGIVFCITMEIAVLTPPVGINLYILQSMAPDRVRITDVIIGCLPFIAAMGILIAVLLVFPEMALWLTEQMKR